MATYTLEQRVFLVKTFYEDGSSVIQTQRKYRQKFNCKGAPSRSMINRLVSKFEKTGSVADNFKAVVGRKKTVRTPVNVARVREALTRSPSKSVKRLSQQLTLSSTSTHRIITLDAKMFPYKIQMHQSLSENAKDRRLDFCGPFLRFLQEHPEALENIWFTDEAHFHLNGYVNKQNMRIWATENPREIMEAPLHPLKCTVWCALSAKGIVGPFFHTDTVNSERYLMLLEEHFIPFIQGMGDNVDETFFQQDGARPHTANNVLDVLVEHFQERVISNRFPGRFGYGWSWPPYSPDLNPCDYYLWGYLKDNVYKNNPRTVDDLKNEISSFVAKIDTATLVAVTGNFQRRLQSVLDADGAHIENVFH